MGKLIKIRKTYKNHLFKSLHFSMFIFRFGNLRHQITTAVAAHFQLNDQQNPRQLFLH